MIHFNFGVRSLEKVHGKVNKCVSGGNGTSSLCGFYFFIWWGWGGECGSLDPLDGDSMRVEKFFAGHDL